MSPSEAQLRAALHEGEGQGVDAGLVIVQANRVRRERRRRVNQIAGGVVVVGAVCAGFVLVSGGGSGDQAGSSMQNGSLGGGARQATTAAAGAGGGGGAGQSAVPAHGSAGTPAPSAFSLARTCPSVPDHIALPAGVTRDEASGPLLPVDATGIRACGYPGGARSRSVLLQQDQARSLAASVNSAPITPNRVVRTCGKDQVTGTVELLATDGTGRHAKPVVITVACPDAVATNGLATRYLPVAPQVLRRLLR
jgi:hypothetical protein